eukprot:symbB.v1.2.007977.t1/scaffold496.1/size195705/1
MVKFDGKLNGGASKSEPQGAVELDDILCLIAFNGCFSSQSLCSFTPSDMTRTWQNDLERASPRALSSRKGNEPKARPKSEASTRSASETRAREAVSELSSVHRARACSVKGHHYKNKSLTSSGLWRDLPLYTPSGLLESTQQPSVSCANLTASRRSA